MRITDSRSHEQNVTFQNDLVFHSVALPGKRHVVAFVTIVLKCIKCHDILIVTYVTIDSRRSFSAKIGFQYNITCSTQ